MTVARIEIVVRSTLQKRDPLHAGRVAHQPLVSNLCCVHGCKPHTSTWYTTIFISKAAIWYLTVRLNLLQYDTTWFDTIWFDMIWYEKTWFNTIQFDTIQYSSIQYDGSIQYSSIRYDMVWYDTVWFDMIREDTVQ